jgi:hypothetical protein
MSRRTRLIATLLLLIAVVGVCASYHGHNMLMTAFRAAQAAAAIGMLLILAGTALSDRLTGSAWRLANPIVPPPLPPAGTRPTVVLLC